MSEHGQRDVYFQIRSCYCCFGIITIIISACFATQSYPYISAFLVPNDVSHLEASLDIFTDTLLLTGAEY